MGTIAEMNGKRTAMSGKEIRRAQMMALVTEGKRTLVEAAQVLGVSYRQAKRIYRLYREAGAEGLVHGNVGKPSHRRLDAEFREQVVERYRERYTDFGPTFAAEKLLEIDGLRVDHETLRRWLIAGGLWQVKRRRYQYRSRRERRARFGELVQFDGSHHGWFERRAPGCCLMNMVDDATGTTLSFLDEQETTEGAMRLLWAWIERYGIPQAVYCDRKNAFVLNREPTIDEQLKGIQPRSPFEQSCAKLGIEVIVAHSPQAKGRVERNHGVYQDRFIKELRLAGISDIETANMFLRDNYLEAVNGKFAIAPADAEDGHVPLLPGQSLENVFCFEEERTVSDDYVLRFENRLYQIQQEERRRLPSPGSRVTVRKWLDSTVHFFDVENTELLVEEIQKRSSKEEAGPLSA